MTSITRSGASLDRPAFGLATSRLLLALCAAALLDTVASAQAQTGCGLDPHPVRCENQRTGDTDWDITGAGDPAIQGFATDMSVNAGDAVTFKIDTAATAYRIDIYRLGYYGGSGARKVATIAPSAALPQSQPACVSDAATGLFDCGNWAVSGIWTVPADAASGVHLAKLVRTDGVAGASHIYFIVRNDARRADLLFQTSDTTWQAYNLYGGASTYCAPSGVGFSNAGTAYRCSHRAVKASYNRPLDTRDHAARSFLFSAEYPMIRFLEANSYDVKYWSGVDTDRRGADLVGANRPRAFLSVGHDEYWSGAQRAHVENARAAGVHLAFFSGNEVYWKHRWEPSTASGTSQSHRTLVVYKETLAGAKIDPAVDAATGVPIWTGTWRDTRFSPPADGGRPENALIGQIWTVECCSHAITVPASMSGLRLWQHTRVAELTTGTASLGSETLGYEWNEVLDNGHQPAGLARFSRSTHAAQSKIVDFGATVGSATGTHSLTLYRHASGALVFGAGTIQWSWGLDGEHDGGGPASHVPDQAMQQATITLLADMGAQPSTLQLGADPSRPLVTVAASSDVAAPVSTVTFPTTGASIESAARLLVTGTATDVGGRVAGVEVSVDGGATWRLAEGTTAWTYEWTAGSPGPAVIRSRAVDDSGNLETAGPGAAVSITPGVCPCDRLFSSSLLPEEPNFPDPNPYELGVKFYSTTAGFIRGIRYFKSVNNTGVHTGSLWSSTGERLATATFTNETPSGWQEVLFDTPVSIAANTMYVASYHTSTGHYAVTRGFFAASGISAPPLHAPSSPQANGNGVFSPGASAFPASTFNANNYWVDVVFAPATSDQTPPLISGVAHGVLDSFTAEVSWTTDEAADSLVQYSTSANFPAGGTAAVSASAFVTTHRLRLNGLTPSTTYFYRTISTDNAGNSSTSQVAAFTLPGPTLRDTVEADFAQGVLTGTYISTLSGGEVMLAPVVGAEFSGNALPAGWVATPWGIGGTATVASGVLRADGVRVGACLGAGPCLETPTFTPGHTLEFVATFSPDAFQHAGLADTLGTAAEPWAIFSTQLGGQLYARTNTGLASENIPLGAAMLGAPHHYRIHWKVDGTVDYYVDGVLRASSTLAVAGPLRPIAASDFNVGGSPVTVDWIRLLPFASAGVFLSRVFDATASVDWNAIQWQASLPPGTTLALAIRGGDTPVPDISWSPFVSVGAPGPLDNLRSRYLQYRATLTSPDPLVTPLLEDVVVTTGRLPVAAADFFRVPENTPTTFPAAGAGSLLANDSDPDPGDVVRIVGITPASRGAVVLNPDGSVTYTPASDYRGPDSFGYTVTDGLLLSSAVVTLDIGPANAAPVAASDEYAAAEDTLLSVPASLGVLANDADAESNPLQAVLVSPPSFAASFTLNADGSFTYLPQAEFAGTDQFTYSASDGTLPSPAVVVRLVVSAANDAPVAAADHFVAVTGLPLVVASPGVLGNDHDVDLNGGALRAALVQTTAHGALVLNDDGSFSYTPAAGFVGLDAFTYNAVDPQNLAGNTATVLITVALDVVSADASAGDTVSSGSEATPDQPLQVSVVTPSAGRVTVARGIVTEPEAPAGFSFLNRQVLLAIAGSDGTPFAATLAAPIRLTLTFDRSLVPAGQSEQTFELFRNGVLVPNCPGASSIGSAALDPCVTARTNGAPATDDIHLTLLTSRASYWNAGLPATAIGQVTARDDGPFWTNAGMALTVASPGVAGNDFAPRSMTVALATPPASGTLALSTHGGFTFTPAAGVCGPASFTYVVASGGVTSAPGTVQLFVNCAPDAVADAVTILEDSGAAEIDVLANDSDPDPGHTLEVASVTQGAHGTVTVAADGSRVSYQPAAHFFGSDTFTYTVRDSRGAPATTTVQVTVTNVNDPPSFVKGSDQSVAANGGPQTIPNWATSIAAGPGESDALSFAVIADNPAIFAVAPAVSPSGVLTYTPQSAGTTTVRVVLTDDGGTANGGVDLSPPQTFTITILPPVDLPNVSIAQAASIAEGNSGYKNVALRVTLSRSHKENVHLDFSTADGTATAGSDYTASSGPLTIPVGSTAVTIYVPVLGDVIGEFSESFYVDIRNARNAVIVNGRSTVTIVNDDNSSAVTATANEFAAGSFEGNAYLSDTTDGELILAPTAGSEFFGSTVPGGWSVVPLAGGGAASVANGAAAVDGAAIAAAGAFGPGRTVEFAATFSGAPLQCAGLGTTAHGGVMAMWFVNAERRLVVRTVDPTQARETAIAGLDWLGRQNVYSVVWNAGSVQYYVNGTLMVTHSKMAFSSVTMTPVLGDGVTGDGVLSVNWLRMTAYKTPGTYISAVFDAGVAVDWKKLTSSNTLLSGTSVKLLYRTGSTPVPDGTWTAFVAPGSGGGLAGRSRYIQYQVQLASTAAARTPTVKDVTVQFKLP